MTNFFGRRRNLRSANWASIRLGMESTIVGIVVFRLAVGAHSKRRHRSGRTVVWDVLNNRVARAAIGAICKWIEVTAVAWCGRIAKTLSAGRDIRRYQSRNLPSIGRFPEYEAVFVVGFQIGDLDFRDTRQHWRLIPQRGEEFVHCRPFGFDFHAGFRCSARIQLIRSL